MKASIIFLFTVFLSCIAYAMSASKYTTKYDNIDLDEILKSDRLLGNYVKCLMEEGKCTPDGAELKKVLPDALKHKCEGCSDKQKQGSKKVVNFLIKNKQDWWKKLEQKYDPNGQYVKDYKDELEKEGIKL
uniref:Chemosensory protein 1 n=1 Tax=Agrilus mali TaxID=1917227 RepID=A0A345F0T9_9COLE|nr:chemosensory protein 1 [Agrilus mali]